MFENTVALFVTIRSRRKCSGYAFSENTIYLFHIMPFTIFCVHILPMVFNLWIITQLLGK